MEGRERGKEGGSERGRGGGIASITRTSQRYSMSHTPALTPFPLLPPSLPPSLPSRPVGGNAARKPGADEDVQAGLEPQLGREGRKDEGKEAGRESREPSFSFFFGKKCR